MGIRRIVSKLLKGSESSTKDHNGWKEVTNSAEIKPFTTGKVTKRFRATVADELTVSKGTKVRAIYREDNWIYVHASDGKRGFVPESYCQLDTGSPKSKAQGNISKIQRRTSRRENEAQATRNEYFHDDLNKSSLERFIDSLPVRKDEGQPFAVTTGTRMSSWTGKKAENENGRKNPNEFLDDIISYTETAKVQVQKAMARCGRYFRLAIMKSNSRFVFLALKRDRGKARVIHRYEAVRVDDVNVWVNDEVVVLNTDDPEWTYVSTEDQLEGFVPAHYLDSGKKATAKVSKAQEHRLVIEDFDGRHALDISVEQGEWVTVVSDDPEGWMWIRRMRDGKEGFLPSRIAILATNL